MLCLSDNKYCFIHILFLHLHLIILKCNQHIMNQKDQIIDQIVSVVNKTAPHSQVFLYGSRARGNAGKSSDWDVLILMNKNKVSFSDETNFMDAFYELELETGEVLSPLIYSKNEWKKKYSKTPLFENIKRDGIQIL